MRELGGLPSEFVLGGGLRLSVPGERYQGSEIRDQEAVD
jgi:hypothetical protein